MIIRNNEKGQSDPYELLAQGIIKLAVRDYRSALRRWKRKPTEWNAEQAKSFENFFRSDYFGVLTNIDPDYLIRRIRSEVMDERNRKISQQTPAPK